MCQGHITGISLCYALCTNLAGLRCMYSSYHVVFISYVDSLYIAVCIATLYSYVR